MPRSTYQMLDAVHWVANSQLGLISAAQLCDIGVPGSTIAYRIRTGGPWRRILPGIYTLTVGQLTVEQKELAGLMFAGQGAVLTGVSALRRHGIRYLPSTNGEVHVAIAVERHRKSAGFVVVERAKHFPTATMVGGHPCADVARAIVDAGRRVTNRRETRAMVLEVVQRELTTIDDLHQELLRAQRRGSALLRESIAEARAGVRSVPEAELRHLLTAAPIPEPLWNPKVYLPGGRFLAQPDGLIVESMVALEVDSRQHHSQGDDWVRTLERAGDLTAAGLLVVSIVPSQMRANPARSVRRIVEIHRQGLRRDPPDLLIVPSDDSKPTECPG
jgi:hypothetical protein